MRAKIKIKSESDLECPMTLGPLEYHLPEMNSRTLPIIPRDKKEFALPPLDIARVSSEEDLFVPYLKV